MIGAEYYLPFWFQSVKGSGPLRSGLLALPFVFFEAVAGATAGLTVHRTGKYMALIWAGVLLMALGFGLLINLKASTGLADIIVFQVLAAVGSGLLMQPPLTALQANVSQRDTASATATFSFMTNLAQAISLVIGGTIFSNSMSLRQPNLLDAGIPKVVAQMYTGEHAAANVNAVTIIDSLNQIHVIRRAYAWSLRNMWIFYAGIAALSVFSVLLIRPHELSTEHTETRTGLRDRQDETEVALSQLQATHDSDQPRRRN